jgi:hypothetical protein
MFRSIKSKIFTLSGSLGEYRLGILLFIWVTFDNGFLRHHSFVLLGSSSRRNMQSTELSVLISDKVG